MAPAVMAEPTSTLTDGETHALGWMTMVMGIPATAHRCINLARTLLLPIATMA
jgi:hypothetical protein